MQSILITGAKGLIGIHLSTLLKKEGFECNEFDHHYDSHHPDFGTILNQDHLTNKIKNCEGIVHLAAVSRVIWGEKDPELCKQTNYQGTKNVLTAALNSPKKPWVIYASSREVYGEQSCLPVQEDFPLKPMNVYAHSKRDAELLVQEAQQENLLTSILRFSNVFGGAEDHKDRVIPAFCQGALSQSDLRIEGSENVFDFTFIDDVVRGILSVIQSLIHEEKSLPPIHFTTGRGINLRQAAEIITAKASSRSQLVEKPPRNFDVSRFYGNPSRAKQLLGWQPEYTFEKAIDLYLKRLQAKHPLEYIA